MAADGFGGFTAGLGGAGRRAVLELHRLLTPVGTVVAFAGDTVPEGYLACDGSIVSRVKYDTLFRAIGETYGAGDGSTTFQLPDLRGRMIQGVGPSDALGSTGGSRDAVVVSHSHTVDPPNTSTTSDSHNHSIDPPNTATTSDSHNHNVSLGTGNANRIYMDNARSNTSSITRVNAPAVNSGGSWKVATINTFKTGSDTHSHTVNIGAFNSSSDSHSHTVNIPAFNSGTTGVSGTDANLPPHLALNWMIRA